MCFIVLEALGIDGSHPAQQSQRLGILRKPGRVGGEVGSKRRANCVEHSGRSGLATTQARAPQHGGSCRLQLGDGTLGAGGAANDVVAHVDDGLGTRLGGEKGVEAGHPIGIGGRKRQPFAHVAQPAGTDPSVRIAQCVEGGEEEVAPLPGRSPPAGDTPRFLVELTAVPAGRGGTEDPVDCQALRLRGD